MVSADTPAGVGHTHSQVTAAVWLLKSSIAPSKMGDLKFLVCLSTNAESLARFNFQLISLMGLLGDVSFHCSGDFSIFLKKRNRPHYTSVKSYYFYR